MPRFAFNILRKLAPVIILSMLAVGAFWEENRPNVVKERLDAYNEKRPLEKVYVQLDRQHYALGDTAWFKVYLTDGQIHQPSPISWLVYVELLDAEGEPAALRYIHIKGGAGAGDFILEKEWAAGDYTLRAYTNYMRNFDEAFFFRRTIRLWNAYSDMDAEESPARKVAVAETGGTPSSTPPAYSLQFFPEGGDLVSGLSATVAFKALDENGQSAAVEGVVLDEDGKMAAFIKSIEMGMGFFSFRPQPGKKYRAEVAHKGLKKSFDLPLVRSEGYALKLKQRAGDQLELAVQTNLPIGLAGSFVIGHIRGNVFSIVEAPENTDRFTAALSTEELPDGIAHFTLFDSTGLPVCERLFYIDRPQNKCELSILAEQDVYAQREKVALTINLQDAFGEPLSGRFSMAVADVSTAPYDQYGEDIRTYLLLNSDLKGHIENPAYFLHEDHPGRRQLLNLLMMTHGWRRFNWEDVLKEELPPVDYIPEQGFSITGYTSKLNNDRQPIETDLFFTVMENNFIMEQLKTKKDGRFGVHSLPFFDSTNVVIQANVENEKKEERRRKKNKEEELGPGGNRNVSIHLDEREAPKSARHYAYPLPAVSKDLIKKLLTQNRQNQILDSIYRAQWSIDLAEVTVKARRRDPSIFDLANQYYKKPDARLMLDSFPNAISRISIFEFLKGRVPGLEVSGVFPDYYVRIRGNSTIMFDNTPLIVVDGVPLDLETALQTPVQEIAYVDVIKGLRTQTFGGGNTGGVIAIYTRTAVGMNWLPAARTYPGILQFRHPGYYRAREFYSPVYEAPRQVDEKPDYRSTLFWAPDFILDEKGKAKLTFYTSDKASSYRILIEGITEDGRPIRAEKRLEVFSR